MNTNFYATNDRPCGVHTGRCHMGGEQYRREMRAVLHDLQQRLGQCHSGLSGRTGCRHSQSSTVVDRVKIRRKLFQKLRSFYTVFYFLRLIMNADK